MSNLSRGFQPLPESTEPPNAFLLFPMGAFTATKFAEDGSVYRLGFEFTDESSQSVMDFYRERQIVDLLIDYEHASMSKPSEIARGAPAAGWFVPAMRTDGLWATNVRWTDAADKKLRRIQRPDGTLSAPEYRGFSPVFASNKDGVVLYLRSCALTNDPAMDAQEPLMAARAVSYESAPIVDGAWDAAAAEKRLQKWASSDGSGDLDKIDWHEYAKGFAFVSGDGTHLGDFHLPHHDIVGGKFVTSKSGVEHAAGRIDQVKGMSDSDKAKVKHHLAEHYHQWGGKAPWETTASANDGDAHPRDAEPEDDNMDPEMMKALTSAMTECTTAMKAMPPMLQKHADDMKQHMDGMTAMMTKMAAPVNIASPAEPGPRGAGNADPMGTTHAMSATEQATGLGDILGALGVGSVSEAKGKVLALVQGAAQLQSLSATHATLKADLNRKEIEGIVDDAISKKKFTPGQRADLVKMGEGDVVALRSLVSNTAVLAFTTTASPSDSHLTTPSTVSPAAQAEALRMASRMGNDPKVIAAGFATV